MIQIAPSILAADLARLGEEVAATAQGGATHVHVDVMDAHFVPNLTIGIPVVESLRNATDLPLDCHLMISDPDRWAVDYVTAGASHVTIHVEASTHLHRVVQVIREAGATAGVALNPATPLSTIEEILPELDLVLIMSVNPGFAGQAFIESSIEKTRRAARMISDCGSKAIIQVDGGVSTKTIGPLAAAGARNFVAGSAIFKKDDIADAVRQLITTAESAL